MHAIISTPQLFCRDRSGDARNLRPTVIFHCARIAALGNLARLASPQAWTKRLISDSKWVLVGILTIVLYNVLVVGRIVEVIVNEVVRIPTTTRLQS